MEKRIRENSHRRWVEEHYLYFNEKTKELLNLIGTKFSVSNKSCFSKEELIWQKTYRHDTCHILFQAATASEYSDYINNPSNGKNSIAFDKLLNEAQFFRLSVFEEFFILFECRNALTQSEILTILGFDGEGIYCYDQNFMPLFYLDKYDSDYKISFIPYQKTSPTH
jgi:hypothetical protein